MRCNKFELIAGKKAGEICVLLANDFLITYTNFKLIE